MTLSTYTCICIFLVIIFLALFSVFIYLIITKQDHFRNTLEKFGLLQTKIVEKSFTVPISLTIVTYDEEISTSTSENISKETMEILENLMDGETNSINGNEFGYPSFFYSNEKWPGCLPPPFFQGTCGSCWGFAAVTALSSRFYIESCGNTGCMNEPQLNVKSLNDEVLLINALYKFKKIPLISVAEYIDINNNNVIHMHEWLEIIKKFTEYLSKDVEDNKENTANRYFVVEILIYMLNFQSFGSMDLIDNWENVKKRAETTFFMWSDSGIIEIKEWEKKLEDMPIVLSAEKIIGCCEDCHEMSYKKESENSKLFVNDPICKGGTLINAWEMLRDVGTTSAACTGYNMDNWSPGDRTPTCHEILGPDYSYCSGYSTYLHDFTTKEINEKLKSIESLDKDPHVIADTGKGLWIDPQLNRFAAKNAYQVNNDVRAIQREISERGPVSTGYIMYEDFQNSFGQAGGGQLYNPNKNTPLGNKRHSLIYMWDGKGKSLGGHAITIAGWGTYEYKQKDEIIKIPYWICLNSWGIEWGTSGFPRYENRSGLPENQNNGGYFWMIRGINNCGIEENVVAGQPDLKIITHADTIGTYGWGLLPPVMEDITLIPPVTSNVFGDDREVIIGPRYVGGSLYIKRVGSYKDKTWEIQSMDPPSPFTFFWGDNRKPLFCLGVLVEDIGINQEVVKVDGDTIEGLKKITKFQKNPIIVIDDEQTQFIEIVGKDKIKLLRGINITLNAEHKKYDRLKVFPFRKLSYDDLDNSISLCDDDCTTKNNILLQ